MYSIKSAKSCGDIPASTPSGIMDQYVSIFGRDHAAAMIDCRDLTHQFVDLPDDLDE